MDTWNPDSYLKFERERTQPSHDLAARIPLRTASSIIDIGCGPGNSTRVLRERWAGARIVGLDKSSKMIEEARRDFPDGEWIREDASKWETSKRFDIVFCNVALQWLSNHEGVLERWMEIVVPGGFLAVQIPFNIGSPAEVAMRRVAESAEWREFLAGCERKVSFEDPGRYYDILSGLSDSVDIWETTYHHVLDSFLEIIDWYRSTGMRPYLAALPDDESRERFEECVLEEISGRYPAQEDGKVLFPFRRLFFVAGREA